MYLFHQQQRENRMSTVKSLLQALQFLDDRGFGDEWLAADHDVIYLPGSREFTEMEEFSHWSEEYDSWIIYT
jgi:hypothetical protein